MDRNREDVTHFTNQDQRISLMDCLRALLLRTSHPKPYHCP